MILWPFVFFRVCYLTCVYPPSPSPAEVSGVDGASGKRRLFYSPVCFGMFILGEHKPLLIRSFSNIRYWLCSSDPRPASQLYGKSDAGLNIGYALFISDIFTFFCFKREYSVFWDQARQQCKDGLPHLIMHCPRRHIYSRTTGFKCSS